MESDTGTTGGVTRIHAKSVYKIWTRESRVHPWSSRDLPRVFHGFEARTYKSHILILWCKSAFHIVECKRERLSRANAKPLKQAPDRLHCPAGWWRNPGALHLQAGPSRSLHPDGMLNVGCAARSARAVCVARSVRSGCLLVPLASPSGWRCHVAGPLRPWWRPPWTDGCAPCWA